MLNKKSIELSLNFIVIVIISIIIFGFGMRFISKLFYEATDLTKVTAEELDSKIGSFACEGTERVCLGNDRKAIAKKKFGVFGVKIVNILESQNFDIEVKTPSPEPIGYTFDKKPIFNPQLTVLPARRTVVIGQNEERNLGIGVEVPANAVSGVYILNVEIKTQTGELYVPVQKLYVEVA